jgi:hypothetical protein
MPLGYDKKIEELQQTSNEKNILRTKIFGKLT